MSDSDRPPGPALAAFDAVYDHQLDYVWRTLGRFGVPSADLDDAVHDVFVIVFRRWGDLDLDRSLRPWLFGVARKVAASRRRKPREALDVPLEASTRDDDRIAQRDLLWRALADLAEERSEVVILHDVEGHTGVEIAALLGIPVNTVHSRLRLARADLAAAVRRHRGTP